MTKTLAPAVDLDHLLAMAEQLGCACNKLFEGLCLVHYAEAERDGGAAPRGFVGRENTKGNQKHAQPDRSSHESDSSRGGRRPDTDFRGAGRGTRVGREERPAKPVRKPGRKR